MSAHEPYHTTSHRPPQTLSESRETQSLLARLHSGSVFPLIASLTAHPVMVSDISGRTVWVNDAFERTSGWMLEAIRGLQPREFLHGPETNAETVQFINQQTERGLAFECEILNYRRDGSAYWLSLDAQPIIDENGVRIGYFSISTNVSTRKRVEQELRQDRDLLKLMSDSLARFISNDDSVDTYGDMLSRLLKLTGSEYGFWAKCSAIPMALLICGRSRSPTSHGMTKLASCMMSSTIWL